MSGRINITSRQVDMDVGAAEGMPQSSHVIFNPVEAVQSIRFSKRFVDRLGIKIKENITSKDVLSLIAYMNDDGIVCLFDLLPDGNEQSVGRQSDDEFVCLFDLLSQDLRERLHELIFALARSPETANGSAEKFLSRDVKVTKGKA